MSEVKEQVDFAEWLSSSPTLVAKKHFGEELRKAELTLDAACRNSTDPSVRAAHQARATLRAICSYLKSPGEFRGE